MLRPGRGCDGDGVTGGAAISGGVKARRDRLPGKARTPRQSGFQIADFGNEADTHYFRHVTFYLLTVSTYAILRLCEHARSN